MEDDLQNIRTTAGDFDGDGEESEGISGEIETIFGALFPSIQEYATNTIGKSIVFTPTAYPYYFIDTNDNGQPDPPEIEPNNQYDSWTPRLVRATYNHRFVLGDPGAYSHNGQYILQILYDTLEDVGGDVSGMVRP